MRSWIPGKLIFLIVSAVLFGSQLSAQDQQNKPATSAAEARATIVELLKKNGNYKVPRKKVSFLKIKFADCSLTYEILTETGGSTQDTMGVRTTTTRVKCNSAVDVTKVTSVEVRNHIYPDLAIIRLKDRAANNAVTAAELVIKKEAAARLKESLEFVITECSSIK